MERLHLNATHDGIVSGTQVFSQDWDLDATGNWIALEEDTDGDGTLDLAQSRSHNAANEVGTIGATVGTNWADPVHDRAGNMTTIPKPSDPANSIVATYDAWNRLVEVTDDSVIVAHYHYDGAGRRVLKIFDSHSPDDPSGLDSHEHVFLLDQQVVETRRSSNTSPAQAEAIQPQYQYVWSPRYIDSLILRDDNAATDGLCEDGRVCFLADTNFSVTALVDSNEGIVERCAYDPYGNVTIHNADWSAVRPTSSHDNTTFFTGRTLDSAVGLMYHRARYYDARLGRFAGRDPIGYVEGRNLYGAHFVPNSTDPSGLLSDGESSDGDSVKRCECKWVFDKVENKAKTRIVEYDFFGITLRTFQDVDIWWVICRQVPEDKCPEEHGQKKIEVYRMEGRATAVGEEMLYPGGTKGEGILKLAESLNKIILDRRIRKEAPSVCEGLNQKQRDE